MDSIYIAYEFFVTPRNLGIEILIAELGHVGFESFVENDNGVTAYIQKQEWNSKILDDLYILDSNEFKIKYSHYEVCLLYTSPSPRDRQKSRMPSSA